MARISMLTPSDKLCTIANGNRSGHDLIVLNCLLKPILFMVTTECIGKKKISKSIWSKTSSKIVWNTRQIPFKIHQTEISKFTNFLQHLNSVLQLPKYRIKNCPTPLNTTNFRPAYGVNDKSLTPRQTFDYKMQQPGQMCPANDRREGIKFENDWPIILFHCRR